MIKQKIRISLSIIFVSTTMIPVYALEACETYDSINDILVVRCDANLAQLAYYINDSTKISLNDRELLLNTTISTGGYTTFTINSNTENISWIKITNGNGIVIGGRAEIDRVKITSWNPTTNAIVSQNDSNSVPRGYIYFQSSNGGWINNSDIGYLGYKKEKEKGKKSYTVGISFYDSYDMILSNNKFHDNYFAFYSANSYNITIYNNEYYHNILYAIDPHTNSHDFRISNNHIHNNYKFGIIFSLRCYNFLIENNTVHDNNEGGTDISYGIFASRVSDNNIIRNNTVYNETIGIDLSQSSNNVVYNNKISSTDKGIFIVSGTEGNSTNNYIYDNEIINSKTNIAFRNSKGNRIVNNTNSITDTIIVKYNNGEYQVSYIYDVIKSFLNNMSGTYYSEDIINLSKQEKDIINLSKQEKDMINDSSHQMIKNSTVIIVFDDGNKTVYDNAYPILKSNNQRAVNYIPVNKPGKGTNYMNWSVLKELYDFGWDISSHTVNHVDIRNVDDKRLNFELNTSLNTLISKGFTKSARFLAYPFGGHDNRVINAAKANGYLAARISGEQRLLQKINLSENDTSLYKMIPFEVFNDTSVTEIENAINETIKQNGTIILEYHTIIADENTTQATQTSLSNFKIISDYIASRKDDINVMTMSEYYDLLKKNEI